MTRGFYVWYLILFALFFLIGGLMMDGGLFMKALVFIGISNFVGLLTMRFKKISPSMLGMVSSIIIALLAALFAMI
jgi:hypothetical protein